MELIKKGPQGEILDEKDIKQLAGLGGRLGYLDVDMQERTLLLYLEQLELSISRLAGGNEGKMPSEHSSGNDGKPAFSDSDVLAATEERGETMDVNLIFRIAAVGILVSVICQVLKHSGRDEQAFLTSLAGLVLVLFWMVPYIYDLFETMKRLFLL